ncbi:hypothetical protein RRG08_052781 [Elysia crispata]|uniref:Uncharacterized protein n=1 Tax=Elysia crispata TaxID=231223 RepID=A0AAE1EC02_9GAST|nr:hypothetical protein RRG08_052781 [Elysia crispata]
MKRIIPSGHPAQLSAGQCLDAVSGYFRFKCRSSRFSSLGVKSELCPSELELSDVTRNQRGQPKGPEIHQSVLR